ncbi:MAG: lipocalin-like domain-containing protein [Ktedonobacteraceae bacterium]
MNLISKVLFQKKWLAGMGLLCVLLLSACSFPGLAETSAQLPKVGENQPAASLPPVRFPQDEGAHNNLTEWWYYTGHLAATDSGGKEHLYGFELVVFQALRSDLPAIYPAHFAISDITRNEFHYDQRRVTNYNGGIPDGKSTRGIDVHVGDWSIQGLNGRDHLVAQMKDYGIQLDLSGTKPATLHNGNGLITYGLGGFSYYYSRTRMAVSGTLLDHNQQLHVTGQAWMDHQWGNFLTLGGGGWDWYSIQLKDNTEMMLYFIRDASGAVLSTYIGYIDANGKDAVIPANALHASVLDKWTSPVTGITYPSGWRLELNDPHVQATLVVKPALKNQELVVTNTTGNTYWEGAVSVDGQANGQPIQGQGYVELTGYAKK